MATVCEAQGHALEIVSRIGTNEGRWGNADVFAMFRYASDHLSLFLSLCPSLQKRGYGWSGRVAAVAATAPIWRARED